MCAVRAIYITSSPLVPIGSNTTLRGRECGHVCHTVWDWGTSQLLTVYARASLFKRWYNQDQLNFIRPPVSRQGKVRQLLSFRTGRYDDLAARSAVGDLSQPLECNIHLQFHLRILAIKPLWQDISCHYQVILSGPEHQEIRSTDQQAIAAITTTRWAAPTLQQVM